MEILRKLFWLTAVAALLVAASACAEDEEEEFETKKYMYGSVDFDIPSYVLKGELVTLTASGIITPVDVKYRWYIKGIYSDSLNASKVTVRFPDSLGVFSVAGYAYADDYYLSTTTKTVTTVDTAFNASLSGLVPSGQSVVDTRDGKKYSYVTVGSLDWFTQNLAYQKTGIPYENSPEAWSLFGNFYTWNEATGGVSASGLGCGPQGACPEGWSVPTAEDWADFASAISEVAVPFIDSWKGLGDDCSADAYLNGERMWPFSPDNLHKNTVGWNAIPLGNATFEADSFSNYGSYAFWWASTEKNAEQGYYRYIYKDLDSFPVAATSKSDFRACVRCVRMHPQF